MIKIIYPAIIFLCCLLFYKLSKDPKTGKRRTIFGSTFWGIMSLLTFISAVLNIMVYLDGNRKDITEKDAVQLQKENPESDSTREKPRTIELNDN